MNERKFKAKLRKHLLPHCHIQSMSSLANAGTPDLWLSGARDLWIEVKYNESAPRIVKPRLTALQRDWLNKRYAEGRSVMVVCGISPSEGVIFTEGEWDVGRFDRRSFDELITIILDHVT